MELLSNNSMVEENSNLTLTKIRHGGDGNVKFAVPQSILDLFYDIAAINVDLNKKWRDLKKGIITLSLIHI